jgi:carbamoyl-phosphate synthase small subunit
MKAHKAYLYLADGECLEGEAFGFNGETEGEVVFSTGMTGYVQSLTDPSFARQILTFTYPLIGNYGVPKPLLYDKQLLANFESEKIWAAGVVVSSFSTSNSHYQSSQSFADWLTAEKIPGIAGIDTRRLTQKLREHGVLQGKIVHSRSTAPKKNWPRTNDKNWVDTVSIKQPITYIPKKRNDKTVAVIDCGVKHGIIRALLTHGYRVIRIPWDYNPLALLEKLDGVICSNGPGDPKNCLATVNNIKLVLKAKIPFLGVCLGHQLLCLALDADTYKLKYGHRGLNQPCQETKTDRCYLTSQNHGYAVRTATIPKSFTEWFINLNDGTNEGIFHPKHKIWSVQFHPEGNPGPFDTEWIFNLL